jgi:hypothetical protein
MRLLLSILALVLAAPAYAGLLDEFGGATEPEIAKKFEQSLPAFLVQQFEREKTDPPSIRVKVGKDLVLMQVVGVKEDKSSWQPLVPTVWFPEKIRFVLGVHGPIREYTTTDIDPTQVARWFDATARTPAELISLAVWLASKDCLMAANAKLAETAEAKPHLRPGIEEWLCTKHEWKRPTDGLQLVKTHHLEFNEDSALLLTPDADAERLKELDKEAKDTFKWLEELQGDDVKSKPGQRKRPPKVRLDLVVDYAERFKKAYAGTKFLNSKRNEERVDKIIEAAKADIAYLQDAQYQADRYGIEKDWKMAGKAWDELLQVDPWNDHWIKKAAEAHQNAAVIYEGGRKAEFPEEAKRAAELYEQLREIYPRAVAWLNFAGTSWLPAGEKTKAKALFEEVIKRAEGRTDLDANEQRNLEYAEHMLKLCK